MVSEHGTVRKPALGWPARSPAYPVAAPPCSAPEVPRPGEGASGPLDPAAARRSFDERRAVPSVVPESIRGRDQAFVPAGTRPNGTAGIGRAAGQGSGVRPPEHRTAPCLGHRPRRPEPRRPSPHRYGDGGDSAGGSLLGAPAPRRAARGRWRRGGRPQFERVGAAGDAPEIGGSDPDAVPTCGAPGQDAGGAGHGTPRRPDRRGVPGGTGRGLGGPGRRVPRGTRRPAGWAQFGAAQTAGTTESGAAAMWR